MGLAALPGRRRPGRRRLHAGRARNRRARGLGMRSREGAAEAVNTGVLGVREPSTCGRSHPHEFEETQNNTDRRERQKGTDIRVIISNPPYSAGQKSQNDNAKNVAYARLDQRIRLTYAQHSNASLLQNLYDSYIRAIRWGSDRLGRTGVMAFVSGSAWIERGIRRRLAASAWWRSSRAFMSFIFAATSARICCPAVWPARARTCSARTA